jgi:formylglycine-generating enzyme required for sulfatase activity
MRAVLRIVAVIGVTLTTVAGQGTGLTKFAPPPGMALVPSGRYEPLFRGEKDPKEITVQAFLLDAAPVTNEEYREFLQANPKWRRSEVKRLFADANYLKSWADDLDFGAGNRSNAPVVHVSWFAAKAYCAWKGKRLPTTVEWEYAAAASVSRPDGGKDPQFKQEILAWYGQPSVSNLPPVASRAKNFFGVHDLHGLVWEWVADFNTAMVTGDARGDTGLDRKLFCGSGSEGTNDRENYPAYMRYAFRSSLKAAYTVHNLGFRGAKDL